MFNANNSMSNLTDNLTFYAQNANLPTWPVLFLLVFAFVGFFGNLLVCMAIRIDPKLQSATNSYLFSLACTDLLVSVLVIPLSVQKSYFKNWKLSNSACLLFVFSDVFLCNTSILQLCIISCERYIGIRNPLKNRDKSKTRTKLLIFSAWTVSFLLASPIIFLSYEDTSNIIQNGNCALYNGHFIIFGSIISFIIPLFIMILMYILTVRRLQKVVKDFKKKHQHEHPAIQTLAKNKKFSVKFNDCRCDGKYFQKLSIKGILKKKKGVNNSDANDSLIGESSHNFRNLVQKHRLINRTLTALQNYRESTAVKNEQKAVKVLGIVFVIFVIAWGPFAIINIMSTLFPIGSIHPSLLDTLTWLGYVSSCINPIIYNAFNKKFRIAFKHVLFCRLKTLQKSSQRRSHNKIMYPKSTNEKDISFQSSSRYKN